jgi:hypothetical protein
MKRKRKKKKEERIEIVSTFTVFLTASSFEKS